MQVLNETGEAVAGLAARIGPSVVGLGRGWGVGSGVVLADGLVAVAAHGLRGEEPTVTLGGERASAEVAGQDPDAGLAVLRVPTGDATPLSWSSEEAGIG